MIGGKWVKDLQDKPDSQNLNQIEKISVEHLNIKRIYKTIFAPLMQPGQLLLPLLLCYLLHVISGKYVPDVYGSFYQKQKASR